MRNWRIKVSKTDGSSGEYAVTPRTIVAFERHFKTGLAAAFANEQKLEHIYWLGWDAERLAGNVVPTFDQWLDKIETVELAVESNPLAETA